MQDIGFDLNKVIQNIQIPDFEKCIFRHNICWQILNLEY